MDQRHRLDELRPDVARLRVAFVNLYFVGMPVPAGAHRSDAPWALVDTGLSTATAHILDITAQRFGTEARPSAIILTHGHFDHVGALEPLLAVWDVPVYAHQLELPFLTGAAKYPPPDPTVGGGMMARLSALLPREPLRLGDRLRVLPRNGEVPGMPGWRWVHTPGHSPGHISLFRETDNVLIAGDAISATRPESVFSILTQEQELHGPPAYFTIDWDKARTSVETLAALRPDIVAAGHGAPIRDPGVGQQLAELARNFNRHARPRRGRYVQQPAVTDERGVVTLPPPLRSAGIRWGMLSGVAAAAFASTWLIRRFGRRTGPR